MLFRLFLTNFWMLATLSQSIILFRKASCLAVRFSSFVRWSVSIEDLVEGVEEVGLEVVFVAAVREAKRDLFAGFAMAKGSKAP